MRALPGFAIFKAEEKKMEGSLHIPDSAKTDIQRGTVIEINPRYFKDGIEIVLDLKKGDKAIFKKYHDQEVTIDGEKYRVVPCDQIMVIL